MGGREGIVLILYALVSDEGGEYIALLMYVLLPFEYMLGLYGQR